MGWYKDANGQPKWVPDGPTATPIGPRNPRLPAQVQGDILGNRQTAVQTQKTAQDMALDRKRVAMQQAQLALQQQAAAQQAQQRALQMRQTMNDARSGMDQMGALNQSVAALRNQYEKNFKGKGIGSVAEYLPSIMRPANGVFDNTAQSLLADMAKAKGLTSQQFNTPAEQKMFFEPLIPKAGDTDEQIVNKIDALQRMVNMGQARYARQLGTKLRPVAPKGAQQQPKTIDFNDLP